MSPRQDSVVIVRNDWGRTSCVFLVRLEKNAHNAELKVI